MIAATLIVGLQTHNEGLLANNLTSNNFKMS